jgi:proline iminopeptidase
LLRDVDKIRHIPCVIVQGRYDIVCPIYTAWALKKVRKAFLLCDENLLDKPLCVDCVQAWPEAQFKLIPDAGHSAYEIGNQAALLDATDSYRYT